MSRHADHGPDCIACRNPDEAARLIAADRAALDKAAVRAREHRAAGDAADHQAVSYLIAGDTTRHQQMQARALTHYQAANGIAQDVMFDREHLRRVENAHPALQEQP